MSSASLERAAPPPRLGAGEPDLRGMVDVASAGSTPLMLFYIDLDHFYSINENMGVDIGDQALALVGERLQQVVGSAGRVWVHGSDEFLVAVPKSHGTLSPEAYGQHLREQVELPMTLLPYTLVLTATVGVALCPEHGRTPTALLRCAETAVAQARVDGMNLVRIYQPGSAISRRSESEMGARIVNAIGNGELRLLYQPQINGHDGRVMGVEALLRWESPDLGCLTPERFMPMAEKLGVIVQMDQWVIHEVLGQARQWRGRGVDDFEVAINTSTLQLLRPGFVPEVLKALQEHAVPAQMVALEVRQSALGEDMSQVRRSLAALQREGVHLTLDDFGMGDSNLDSLIRFSVDKIKIHRGFISGVPGSSSQTAITCAIIAMGHQLGMKVIAHGVETETQLAFLRRNHCDIFQGHLLGEPMDGKAAGELLRRRYLHTDAFNLINSARTLLLLDDEENVLRSLTRLFRRDGYRVLVANNVVEAFEHLATQEVQVILSDQRMSDMSGTEFLGRVRTMYPDIMGLVLSGHTDLATVTEAINTGQIYRFLTKPWNDDELRDHIREAFVAHESPSHQRLAL